MAPFPSKVGRYEIVRALGRGAMGAVFLGRDPLIARSVAVKMLPPLSEDPGHMQRLLAEARIAGALDHPNIVRVFDVGEDDGQPFVVMQYVEGRTLAAVLADPVRPLLDAKIGWMVQLCDGLAHAHEHRVIHRDLKPSNLMIDTRGALRILDFGVAKIVSTSQIKFTSIGTPAYMAPEQYSKAPVDPRTDIFAAGLMLFEMITHTRALEGDSPVAIFGQLMRGEIRRLADAAPGVDAGLAAICDRATASDPLDRYQTASAMGAALADVRRRLSAARGAEPMAPRPPLPPPPAPAESTDSTMLVDAFTQVPMAPPPEPRASPWTLLAGLAAGAAILGVLVVAAVLRTGSESGAPPPVSGASAAPTTGAPTVPAANLASPAPTRTEPPKTEPGPSEQTAQAPVIGRLLVFSDLDGALFTATPARGRGVIRLSAREPNVLSPARYDVHAAFFDRDPLLGDTSRPTTSRQVIDVTAGRTATVRFTLETALWRDRFERALARPAGQRAEVLDRTYRRLKELSSTTPTDETRFTAAAGEQQFVTLVRGDFTSDTGQERYAIAQVDVVQLDRAPRPMLNIGAMPPTMELTKGRHEFVLVVTARSDAGAKLSAPCSGSFAVPGGPSALRLKVDAIARRPNPKDGLTADCQIGGTVPLKRTVVPEKPNPPQPRLPLRLVQPASPCTSAATTSTSPARWWRSRGHPDTSPVA
jgi:eukaryotic-like serine/threonine-protein kinase